jgi:hypothetical protein
MDAYNDPFPSGMQTFATSFANQGCYIFCMCDIVWDWSKKFQGDVCPFVPGLSPLMAAKEGVSLGLVSDEGLMRVLDYPSFMNYLTSSFSWKHRKELPGYVAKPGEYLIGRYSGILKINPIKHYVRMSSDGSTILKDSMVNSPITKKGSLSSIHVFWEE